MKAGTPTFKISSLFYTFIGMFSPPMKGITITVIVTLLAHFSAVAQFENHFWFFGNSTTGVQFDQTTNQPSPFNVQYTPWGGEGTGVVTDPITGQLLFYSDGARVINANHVVMNNGGGMVGNPSSAQAVAFCPVPAQCNKYYIFSNAVGSGGSASEIRSTIVDMNANGGLGDVPAATKNILVRSGVKEGMIMVPRPGLDEYWLIGTNQANGSFYVYKIDINGINLVGTPTFGSCSYTYNIRYSAASGKICVACPGGNLFYTLDFNVNTGALSNYQVIDNMPSAYDSEWSADGTKLYYSSWSSVQIRQYDYNTGTITPLWSSGNYGGGLKMAPDGKIYHISQNTGTFLSTINNPNAAGTACNYTLNAYNAGGTIGGLKLPEVLSVDFFAIELTGFSENISCNGANDGRAWVEVTGGTAPYTYEWSDGQTTDTAVGLAPGIYDVIVTDAIGCRNIEFISGALEITEPPVLDITATIVDTVSCNGGMDGILGATATGGTQPYTYAWNTLPPQFSQTATGLPAGPMQGGVMDANGCTDSVTINMVEPTVLALDISGTDALCFGGSDGTATVTATGGNGGYSYNWDSTPAQSAATANNLSAGLYNVTVMDSKNCTQDTSITINEPADIVLTMSLGAVSCAGGSGGTATVTPNGGTPGYSYQWSTTPAQTNPTATNLVAGTYTVTVTDANQCVKTADTTVVEPLPLMVTKFDSTDVSCNGGSDGTATVTVTGGTFPYSYTWTGGGIDSLGTGFPAGTPSVTVTDANGCTATVTFTINEPPALSASISSSVDAKCNGSNDGEATALENGGVGPYDYSWSSGGMAATATGLSAGAHTVTITDANGCVSTATVTINQPSPIVFSSYGDTLICIGQTAPIGTNTSGGTQPYSYIWSNGPVAATQTVSPSVTTNYTVTITDGQNCTVPPETVIVTVRPPITATTSEPDTICETFSTTVSASAAGGDGNFSYAWDNGVASGAGPHTVSPVVTTTYTVTVTDGCGTPADNASVTILVNPLPDIAFTADPEVGCMPLEVEFLNQTTLASGSVFKYDWTFGDTATSGLMSPVHVYEQDGVYDVSLTVTSAAGCSDSLFMPALITVYPLPEAGFTLNPPFADMANPVIDFTDKSTDAVAWDWYFGDLTGSSVQNPTHEYPDSGLYTIIQIVSNEFNCTDTATDSVRIDGAFLVYIPNAFTPSGDSDNEIFIEKGMGIKGREMRIFNRWGEQVFFTQQMGVGWDGLHPETAEPLEQGVYVYYLNILSILDEPHQYRGKILLIR